jgi:hypothetical protein
VKNLPNWIISAMKDRFDELCLRLERQPSLEDLDYKIDQTFRGLINGVSEQKKGCFLQWEEHLVQIRSREKEWIYQQGLKDGAELMFSLIPLKDEDTF